MGQTTDDFPTFLSGFAASVRAGGEHYRLFAHVDEEGWAASVYRLEHGWVVKSERANNTEDAKRRAELTANNLVPGKYVIEWCEM